MIERKFFVRKILTIAIASAMITSCATFACAADDEETEADLRAEINGMKEELEQSEKTEEELDEEIARLSEECAATYSDIETLNIEKQTYIESMTTRIVYFYENESSYGILESLIEDGFSGFQSRIEYMKGLYDYDSAQLDEYTDLIELQNEKKAELDARVEELDALIAEQEARQHELTSAISEKETELAIAKKNEEKARARAKTASSSGSSGEQLTKEKGVVYYNGHKETYYSQKVLPGNGLSIPGRHVDNRGIICDCDGYICVASSDYPKGTVVATSLGTGKVYDSGCASGTIDIYTDW